MPKGTESLRHEKARSLGAQWARSASNAQLDRLAAADDHRHGWLFNADPSSAFTAAQDFYFIIEPDDRGDRDAAQTWADAEIPEDDQDDREFMAAFAEGATSEPEGAIGDADRSDADRRREQADAAAKAGWYKAAEAVDRARRKPIKLKPEVRRGPGLPKD